MERFVKIESKQHVHVLSFFRKADQADITLIACDDLKELREFARYLDMTIGYQAGIGVHSQDAPGYYCINSIPVMKAGELYHRQSEVINRARNSEH